MSCLASVRFELYSLSPDEADELTFWVLNSQRIISKDYSLALISACLVMIWGQVLRGFKLRSLSIFNLGPKGRVWPLDGAKLTTLPAHARRPRGSRECTYFGGSSSGDPHTQQQQPGLSRPSDVCVFSGAVGLSIQLMFGGHCSSMQINALLLKSPLFWTGGVTAERPLGRAETPAVVREALEQQARDRL